MPEIQWQGSSEETEGRRESGGHVKMEAAARAMWPPARGRLEPRELEEAGGALPQVLGSGAPPAL